MTRNDSTLQYIQAELPKDIPKQAMIAYNKALKHQQAGEHKDAARLYHEAISHAPTFALAHNNLGVLFYSLGRHDKAEVAYREAIALSPNDSTFHNNLGRFSEAADAFRKAIALDPQDPLTYRNLGEALSEQGLTEEAEAEFKIATELEASAGQ